MSRLEQIREMLADEPDDVFLNYALALELDKAGDHDASLDMFQKLAGSDSPYVPAYFMAAQMLNRLERVDEARKWLRDGIPIAKEQGNSHAAAEMSEFLEMISDD